MGRGSSIRYEGPRTRQRTDLLSKGETHERRFRLMETTGSDKMVNGAFARMTFEADVTMATSSCV